MSTAASRGKVVTIHRLDVVPAISQRLKNELLPRARLRRIRVNDIRDSTAATDSSEIVTIHCLDPIGDNRSPQIQILQREFLPRPNLGCI